MAKLHFRFASMNAGKSTQLLQIRHNYQSLGRNVLLLTAALDDRFGVGAITSRLGVSAEADVFRRDTDMFALVEQYRGSVTKDELGAILIDEAQFLSVEQVQQLHRAVHTLHVPVLCFGLRSDFQGNAFPGAAMLLTLAEDIEELKNVCACGSKATMNMRVDSSGQRVRAGPQVLIGDATYRQVCAKCFYCDEIATELEPASQTKYLVHENWGHIFHDDEACTVRFVFDTELQQVTFMEVERGSDWFGSSREQRADVTQSLVNANEEVLANPQAEGVLAVDVLPAWAVKQASAVKP